MTEQADIDIANEVSKKIAARLTERPGERFSILFADADDGRMRVVLKCQHERMYWLATVVWHVDNIATIADVVCRKLMRQRALTTRLCGCTPS